MGPAQEQTQACQLHFHVGKAFIGYDQICAHFCRSELIPCLPRPRTSPASACLVSSTSWVDSFSLRDTEDHIVYPELGSRSRNLPVPSLGRPRTECIAPPPPVSQFLPGCKRRRRRDRRDSPPRHLGLQNSAAQLLNPFLNI